MNSTKLKKKLTQKSTRALALRNDSKLKKYNPNKKNTNHDKNEASAAKIISEVIQIKRRRIKYMKTAAFGDTDSIKSSSDSQESVIYVGTKYPKVTKLFSIIDLTKSETDLIHPKNKQRKSRMNNKQITTIQSANNLGCRSSEDIGLVVKNLNETNGGNSSTKSTQSGILLRRTRPCTSMSENENENGKSEEDDALVPADGNPVFFNEVSDMITRDLRQINDIEKMVYGMDIDAMAELYNVNAPDRLDDFDT